MTNVLRISEESWYFPSRELWLSKIGMDFTSEAQVWTYFEYHDFNENCFFRAFLACYSYGGQAGAFARMRLFSS
jgi:hypothetical protein